jgi:hypothetical protein
MAVNFGHGGYTSNVDKITDTLNNFFSTAFQDQHKNKFFNLHDVKTVVGRIDKQMNSKTKEKMTYHLQILSQRLQTI